MVKRLWFPGLLFLIAMAVIAIVVICVRPAAISSVVINNSPSALLSFLYVADANRRCDVDLPSIMRRFERRVKTDKERHGVICKSLLWSSDVTKQKLALTGLEYVADARCIGTLLERARSLPVDDFAVDCVHAACFAYEFPEDDSEKALIAKSIDETILYMSGQTKDQDLLRKLSRCQAWIQAWLPSRWENVDRHGMSPPPTADGR